MDKKLSLLIKELTDEIEKSYNEGVTMEYAERLASRFLYAQLTISSALKDSELDARMKKSGLKAVKAAVFLEEVRKADKKPSDSLLSATVDVNELVIGEQKSFDEAEVECEHLNNAFNVFKEAHIFFRGISKGRFE